ncbi:MAG: glycosyltransferase family 4 protein [Chloroflexi bacterium]|nr:glycosyltransferase family 4 protein [Chloroflexota bacterium]
MTATSQSRSVGFVSTRFAGTDGVSLETEKWAHVFEQNGFACHYLAGELDLPPERSLMVEEAHFLHPAIREIYRECFGSRVRKPAITASIQRLKGHLKSHLHAFKERFKIDLLVVENALSIPLNIPLGLALAEFISETGIPTIGHHHDFFWERKQFLVNCVWEYLNMAFPPHLPFIHHVVINSSASNQLSTRTGISATLIPNVMDFENPPAPPDSYASDVRQAFGIADDQLFILQPTRIVQRKGIEHAIELVGRLGLNAKLVISHSCGDEGYDYLERIKEYSQLMKVDTLIASDIVGEQRGRTADGRKIYSLYDVYPYADLVTYPSDFEGFGNAFLESIYYRRPIVVNAYSVYSTDIKPKGFRVIELDGYVTQESLRQTREVLLNPDLREQMVKHNYRLALQYYSYSVLRRKLEDLIADSFGD